MRTPSAAFRKKPKDGRPPELLSDRASFGKRIWWSSKRLLSLSRASSWKKDVLRARASLGVIPSEQKDISTLCLLLPTFPKKQVELLLGSSCVRWKHCDGICVLDWIFLKSVQTYHLKVNASENVLKIRRSPSSVYSEGRSGIQALNNVHYMVTAWEWLHHNGQSEWGSLHKHAVNVKNGSCGVSQSIHQFESNVCWLTHDDPSWTTKFFPITSIQWPMPCKWTHCKSFWVMSILRTWSSGVYVGKRLLSWHQGFVRVFRLSCHTPWWYMLC